MGRRVVLIGLAVLGAWGVPARATPDAARWHREMLLGEDAECFVRLVTERDQPGSYYSYVDVTRLQRVRRMDLRVVEDTVVREVVFSSHPDSQDVWRRSEAPRPAFDLFGYLRRHAIENAWACDEPAELAIDDSGVWVIEQGIRERLITRAELLRRIPDLGEAPRVSAQETTTIERPTQVRYIHVLSNTASYDDSWSEHLLMVSEAELAAALARLEARLPEPKR